MLSPVSGLGATASLAPGHSASRGLTRLQTAEDIQRITWRDGALFHDWILAWGDPEEASTTDSAYRVHRVVLVGGQRPAHYFAGAVRFGVGGTDLSKLLPDACRPAFEKALDFMYGEPLTDITSGEATLLFKIADVLQCPSLRNYVLDEVSRMLAVDSAACEMLVAAAQLGISELAEALVQSSSAQALWQAMMTLSRENLSQLATVIPVVMDRIGCGFAAAWGGIEHEGGSVRYDGPVIRFTGGGTCIAWTQGEVRSGQHCWRIRIDEVHNASGFVALGVVAGPKDTQVLGDMDSWHQWYLYYSDDGKKRTKGEADLQDYSQPYLPGDVISIVLDLSAHTLEFAHNDRSCGPAYGGLPPGMYRVGAELGNSASDMQITLMSYECLSSGGGISHSSDSSRASPSALPLFLNASAGPQTMTTPVPMVHDP